MSADASLVVGVDGGGTRTRVALARLDGRLVGAGEAGASNPRAVGLEGALRSVAEALRAALSMAGARDGPLAAARFGLAGAGEDAASAELRAGLEALLPDLRGPAVLEPDLSVALEGAFPGADGVVVVAGTGSAAIGRAGGGEGACARVARSGGHGPRFDDAGSALDLGRRAVAACLRAADGRGRETALSAALFGPRGALEALRFARRALAPGAERARVAALAPGVLACAREGDAVARELVAEAARELALLAVAVARALDEPRPRVALVGGLRAAGAALREPLTRALRAQLAAAELVEPALVPVLGACLLAARDAGGAPATELAARLAEQAPRFDLGPDA